MTTEEARAIAIGRARDNVRKWENIVGAAPVSQIAWAERHMEAARAVLTTLENQKGAVNA